MTREQLASYSNLIQQAEAYITNGDVYAQKSMVGYKSFWRRLVPVMIKHCIKEFTDESSKKLLSIAKTLPNSGGFVTSINKLAEFQSTGKITPLKWWRKKRAYDFRGPIGEQIKVFVDENRKTLSTQRCNFYEINLFPFSQFCLNNNLTEYNLINVGLFIKQTKFKSDNKMKYSIQCLVRFTKFQYAVRIIPNDFSHKIPKPKIISQPKIPSVYTPREIQKIMRTISRSNSTGKRDYSIFLIVKHLGMRISDVANLKFINIDLANDTIKFNQKKTGKLNVLPLLDEIKTSLVDYLKNGRAKSKEPYIFLSERPPYSKMSLGSLSHIFNKAISQSKVKVENRTSGPRAFRSSLASAMMDAGTSLPTIAQILGHFHLTNAKHYTRIDYKNLSLCTRAVPKINPSFYLRNGFIR
jgi:integrase